MENTSQKATSPPGVFLTIFDPKKVCQKTPQKTPPENNFLNFQQQNNKLLFQGRFFRERDFHFLLLWNVLTPGHHQGTKIEPKRCRVIQNQGVDKIVFFYFQARFGSSFERLSGEMLQAFALKWVRRAILASILE